MEASHGLVIARRPRERDLDKLIQFAQKYPQRPQFKNYLINLAKRLDRQDVIQKYTQLVVAQHPDYLFGKIEQASQAIERKDVEKVPIFLGKRLELKDLYPEKEVFHVSEFEHFEYTVIRYFIETGKTEEALFRLSRLQDAGFDSDIMDHLLSRLNIVGLLSQMELMLEASEKLKKASAPKHPLPKQRKEAPTLTHPELLHLFDERGKVSAASLAPLLALPRESLIRDLATIVEDAAYRYRHFEERFDKENYRNDSPLAALAMLCELEAGEAGLKPLLFLLGQNEDVLEFWLGDSLTEDIWRYVYDLGQHSLPLLFEFLSASDGYEFSYSPIRKTIEQLLLHQPEKIAEVEEMIGATLRKLANSPILRKVNPGAATALASLCLDFHLSEFEQELKILYQAELVDTWQLGSWEEYVAALNDAGSPDQTHFRKAAITPPLKRFDDLLNAWKSGQALNAQSGAKKRGIDNWLEKLLPEAKVGNTSKPKPSPLKLTERRYLNEYGIPFKRESAKIGRNERCPCGSGKKYKQCCGK